MPPAPPHEVERAGAEHAVGRPIAARCRPGRTHDRVQSPIQVALKATHRSAEQQAVPIPVQADLVSRGGNLGRQLRVTVYLFPDEEERGGRSSNAEQLEHRRSALPVRPVVECKRDALRRPRQLSLKT
jgi:hypothetical protein